MPMGTRSNVADLDISKTSPLYVPARQLTFHDQRMRTGRGGPRPGAGRPRGPRPRVAHRQREAVPGSCPVHVTIRVRPDVSSLRSKKPLRELRRGWRKACERGEFRIVHPLIGFNEMGDRVRRRTAVQTAY